jgi:acetyltransferase
VLLVAPEGSLIQGAVQLDLEMRANGNHRAEAMKLFVHLRARRRGLAKALLAELEAVARCLGRSLLVRDTCKGGEVPNYARSANGQLHTTVFFYRPLDL